VARPIPPPTTAGPLRDGADARERILHTAYDLFSREGVLKVGVDRIIAEAGVSKTTFYRRFRSKEELILAVLELREALWTFEWLEGEIVRRAQTPTGRLMAIFDVFDEWFHRSDYEGCLFTNVLIESHDRTSRIGAAGAAKRENIRVLLRGLAQEAGVSDPKQFAYQWQMLMTGALVIAAEGDLDAARRAREVAELLLAQAL
jgi:AcrR family transcriptional regulator